MCHIDTAFWARVFVEMLFTLGWRKSEVINLRVSSVNLLENVIRIERTKNDEPREIGLSNDLRILLQSLYNRKEA